MEDNQHTRLPDDPIDSLFKSGLKDQQVIPDARIWKGINKRLFFRELFRFQFSNLTRQGWISLISGVVILVAVSLFLIWQQEEPKTHSLPVSEKDTDQHTSQGETLKNQEDLVVMQPAAAKTTTAEGNHPAPIKHSNQQIQYSSSITDASEPLVIETSLKDSDQQEPLPAAGINESGLVQTREFIHRLKFLRVLTIKSFSEEPIARQLTPVKFRQLPSFIQPIEPKEPLQIYGILHFTPDLMFYRGATNYYKYHYTFGLTGGLNRGCWYAETGLSMSWSSDIGRYQVDYIQHDSVGFYNQILSFTVNPANPGEVTFTTTKQTVFDSVTYLTDLNTKNRYTYLRIPLSVGYYFINRDKIRLGLDAGAAVSFMIARSEPDPVFYAPDANTRDIQSLTHTHLPVNWMLTTGVRLEYLLTNKLMLLIEPGFSYYLKGIEEVNAVATHQPYAIGLKAGLKFNFKLSKR